jgi:hypothetical protein
MRENFQQKKPTQHSKKEREREGGKRKKPEQKKKNIRDIPDEEDDRRDFPLRSS